MAEIVERAIPIWGAIKKRSQEQNIQNDTKSTWERMRVITFATAKLE